MRLLFPSIIFLFLISFLTYIVLKQFDLNIEDFFTSSSEETTTVDYMKNLEIPFGIKSDKVIVHKGYTLSYNELHEQANWVAYALTRSELAGTHKRTDDFRDDPSVLTGSAELDDYRGSGFDRGHLAPAADMKWSEDVMSESFYLSNISPQDPEFNRGIWRELEEYIRDRVHIDKQLYIVTGPVLHADLPTIGSNEVTVPEYYFKTLLDYTEPEIKAIGFLMKNEKSEKKLKQFAVAIDSVERFTGIDFYPLLPDSIEEVIEANATIRTWFSERKN